MNSVGYTNLSLKYQNFTPSDYKDIDNEIIFSLWLGLNSFVY